MAKSSKFHKIRPIHSVLWFLESNWLSSCLTVALYCKITFYLSKTIFSTVLSNFSIFRTGKHLDKHNRRGRRSSHADSVRLHGINESNSEYYPLSGPKEGNSPLVLIFPVILLIYTGERSQKKLPNAQLMSNCTCIIPWRFILYFILDYGKNEQFSIRKWRRNKEFYVFMGEYRGLSR